MKHRLFSLVRISVCFGVLASIGASPREARAIGEQEGRLRGTVVEAGTSKPLPAVSISATSPALIGPPRTTMSNDRGRFELQNLPSGTYTVTFSYEGVIPLTRTVEVRVGEAASLNVSWVLATTGIQTVSVSQGRQLTRPDSTHTGTVMEMATRDRLPTGRSYQDAAQDVPGATGGANPNIKGGFFRSNRYLIDGLDATDPVTGTFSLNLAVDGMYAVETITGGMSAEYNAMGGIVNVITPSGSDEFHVNVSVYANHHKLSAGGVFGSELYEDRMPFADQVSGPTQSYQLSLNVGGPIIPRKLWYSLTYELRVAETSPAKLAPLGAPPFNIQHPPRDSQSHQAMFRLSYAPSAKHRLWFAGNTSPGFFNNIVGGNSRLGVAEERQNQNAVYSTLGWDWFVSDNLTTHLQVGALYSQIESGPQGWLGDVNFTGAELFSEKNRVYERDRARHVNTLDNTTWYQGGAYQDDKRYRVQVDPNVTLTGSLLGEHTLKAGVQAQFNYRTRDAVFPGEQIIHDGVAYNPIYFDRPSAPLEGGAAGLCDPASPMPSGCFRRIDVQPLHAKEKSWGVGLFIQDRWWTPLEWLTVLPGIRADYGATYDRNGRRVTSLFALAPRLGATADLTGDDRNILFGYYGRSTETISLLVASSVDAIEGSRDITWQWDPATNDFTRKLAESGGEGGIVIDKNAKAPHSDEWTLGLRREIFDNSAVTGEYTYKRFANIWEAIEINRIYDPTGSRVVGWVDPDKQGRDVILYATPDNNLRTYHGITLAAEGEPTPAWWFGASYNLTWTYGPGTSILGGNQFDNPRQRRFYVGFNGEDQRHFIRLSAAYEIAKIFNIGAFFRYLSGSPVTKNFWNAFDAGYVNLRSPIGTAPTTPNDPNAIAELRTPDVMGIDLRLRANLSPAREKLGSMYLIMDVFNAFNLRTPTSFQTNDIAAYGQVTGRRGPLRVQLALEYAY